ncbi:MAG TPA: molybdopterin dinucleotide binding domain-containing protein [Armatimonadota bacterium]
MREDGLRENERPEEPTLSRREWFKLAALGGLLGLGAQTPRTFDQLIPLLVPNEQIVPGQATWYATSCRECPAGCGMLVRNREGRAVKCEGNPDHPLNAGRLCARGQAALQGLYDPDRRRAPVRRRASGEEVTLTWADALTDLGKHLAPLRHSGRVAVISDLQTGSLAALLQRWLAWFGSDRYLIYEPLNYEGLRGGLQAVEGRPYVPVYRLEQADFVLSLGADFLDTWVSPVHHTQRFVEHRHGANVPGFVYAGPRLSLTAAAADARLLVAPGQERLVALALLQVLAAAGPLPGWPAWLTARRLSAFTPEAVAPVLGVTPGWLRDLARRWAGARAPVALGDPGVSPGPEASETAAAAHLLNLASGTPALAGTVDHALGQTATAEQTRALLAELDTGAIDTLIVFGANPAYSLPDPGRWQVALEKVRQVISLTPYRDETSLTSHWALPVGTPLECWGDYEPQTGVANLLQPTTGPLYGAPSPGDALLLLAAAAGCDLPATFGASSFHEYLRNRWRQRAGKTDFEEFWRESLRRGGVWSEPPASPRPTVTRAAASKLSFSPPAAPVGPRLCLFPTMTLFDGRGAHKRWLQELPDPMTKIIWESWVEISPATAQAAGLSAGQVVTVEAGGRQVTAPLLVTPGVAPGTVAIPLGQGHTAFGRYAQGRGVNAFPLGIAVDAVTVTPTGRRQELLRTDGEPYQLDREIVRMLPRSQLATARPEPLIMPLTSGFTRDRDLYAPPPEPERRWAMAIDLSRCTGCSACVTACYAENNLGVVGPDHAPRQRVMSWVRVDRYFDWRDPQAPAVFQPMLCQHCEAAPCEPVCPVFASAHNEEGLNMQVYNRCVGTRYCSNNCPYKVRRFNWFDYDWPEPLNWQANPEVSVRCRGVMEKCSFCIQRIREVEFRARQEGRPVRDGEVTPACAQTCPAQVFTFGDLRDPQSKIARLVATNPRAYQVLPQLNTKPAVFYLKKILND